MKKAGLMIIACFLLKWGAAQEGFSFMEQKEKQQLDVYYNGRLMTAYCYYDSSRKPVLFPVNTIDGITVTRSYPFRNVPGERTDHPHHTGIWMNYESVNGLDFWNNSTAIPVEKRNSYGAIIPGKIIDKQAKKQSAKLVTSASWIRPDHKVLLDELTTFDFVIRGNDFIIDRTTKLTAKDTAVVFRDVKDGFFAIRVARELELPSKEKSNFVDDKGNVTTVPPSNAADVSGMYYGSTGLKGDSVWSSKGPWVMLTGKKEGKEITIGIIDHPANTGYPAYWHARGYGLFAINPLGRKIFSNGKEELNLALAPGQSVTFRYRVVIHSGLALTPGDMDRLTADFAQKN